MLQADRCSQIYELIKEKQSVTVHYLSKRLYASETTIRRDLESMEQKNLIKRVWGGAMLPTIDRDIPSFVREHTNIEAKDTMASLAARFLTNSCTIFMDSSSSCLSLIPYIKEYKNIVVITSSLRASRLLSENTSASISLLGGQVYEGTFLTGHLAVESVKQYHTDLFFFSCSGISVNAGLTSIEPKVIEVSREMMRHTNKKILLCDSSKVGKETLLTLADLSVPDYVVMERLPEDKELVRALGSRLLTAQ